MLQMERKKNWNVYESGSLLIDIRFTVTHQRISDQMSSACISFAFPQAAVDSRHPEIKT